MSTKKTIYIIRHGQTDYNKRGIIQGSGIDSSLNETGIQQAEQFYNAYHHIHFDTIYTSSLKRTQETVAPFVRTGKSIEILTELDEINWGIFEGLKSTPDNHQVYLNMINDWKAGLLDRAVEGGETPNQMQKRQQRGLEKLLEKQHENQILICMHGRAMRSFLCLLTETPLQRMDEFKHNNVCLYVLKQNENKFDIVEQNCSKHLWL